MNLSNANPAAASPFPLDFQSRAVSSTFSPPPLSRA